MIRHELQACASRVQPKGKQGIVKISDTENLFKQGYRYKIKILGKGGDIRIYGKSMENGHIFFDKMQTH